MIGIFLTILVFIVATCFSIIAIVFTISVVKECMEDIFYNVLKEKYKKDGARELWAYISKNAEDELHAMDKQYRQYTVDSIYEVYKSGRWLDE